jgi:RNA polymerase sigma-70 factor (ECF subfamily)
MGASSDEELVAKARAGDDTAMSELLSRHGPEVRRGLTGRIPPRLRSLISEDDVMQQTYTDAFLGIGNFTPKGENAMVRWLTRVAQRNLLDAIEMLEADKRGGKARKIESPGGDESYVALYELMGASSSTPSRKAATDEAKTALEDAIKNLPENYAKLIRMYDLEGQPIEDVAKAFKKSSGAVYMLRARAHRRLREIMGASSQFFTDAS